MKMHLKNPQFVFFSDDLDFVKDNFDICSEDNYFLVTDLINSPKEDIVDLFLIAACKKSNYIKEHIFMVECVVKR